MSSDNVIHLAARRDSEAIGHASGRNAERDRTRWNEADALLQKLRETKRLKKADQATLVDNIGRLIATPRTQRQPPKASFMSASGISGSAMFVSRVRP